MRMNHLLFQVLTRPPVKQAAQRQRGSAAAAGEEEEDEEEERQTGIEAPGGAADRQTDVWADGQMTAPEGLFFLLIKLRCAAHPPNQHAQSPSPRVHSLSAVAFTLSPQ